jgi:aminomethyltransferase
MKVTQLYSYHREHAKLTEFAGYEMPLWYTSTTEEHLAVRNKCGVFDVSHMGRFAVKGAGAWKLLESLVPTQVQQQPSGKAFYTLFLNEKGGIIDDLIITKHTDSEFLVVVNAANAENDLKHIRDYAQPGGVEVEDITDSSTMIAVQGPEAAAVLQPLIPSDLGQVKRFRSTNVEVLGQSSVVSRTGYTGEDGFEVIIRGVTKESPEDALAVWERLVGASAACGLSARDSLRLEAGFPLHGLDIDQETDPFSADLGWVVSVEKKDYVGYDAISKFRESPPSNIKRGVIMNKGIPRHGFAVFDSQSNHVGLVTSGSFSPILKRGIALCRVKRESSEIGATVGVRVRDSTEEGHLVRPPFYDETHYGWKRTT